MCGRYASTRSSDDLATLFDAVDDTHGEADMGYNLAPTRSAAVVRRSRSAQGRVVSAARWGLVPSWAKDVSIGNRMFNARAEKVATSAAFRAAFSRRRCLIPVDGWFEWAKRPGKRKQPYFLTSRDGEPIVFAGLWEVWKRGEETLLSTTILTTAALGELERVHDRMPLLLSRDRFESWLGESGSESELLEPPDTATLRGIELRPVGTQVGNVAFDHPGLVREVSEGDAQPHSAGGQQPTLF
ncbi:MAG TPA: SOS response-associated peptidase [Candidatus Stackebrandtia faecavium]|nr:SOS response-associated peptidase [Candidatus Stackebrandtia faecavium]